MGLKEIALFKLILPQLWYLLPQSDWSINNNVYKLMLYIYAMHFLVDVINKQLLPTHFYMMICGRVRGGVLFSSKSVRYVCLYKI